MLPQSGKKKRRGGGIFAASPQGKKKKIKEWSGAALQIGADLRLQLQKENTLQHSHITEMATELKWN